MSDSEDSTSLVATKYDGVKQMPKKKGSDVSFGDINVRSMNYNMSLFNNCTVEAGSSVSVGNITFGNTFDFSDWNDLSDSDDTYTSSEDHVTALGHSRTSITTTVTTATAAKTESKTESKFDDTGNDEKTEDEDKQCVSCMENKKMVLYTPCNHLCVCFKCSREIHAREDMRKCPMCREEYKDRIRVFT